MLAASILAISLVAYSLDLTVAHAFGRSELAGLASIFLVLPASLYLAYHTLKLQASLTLRFAARYVVTWRALRGTSPPWPFSWFDVPEPHARDAFLLNFILLPVAAVHALVLLCLMVALGCVGVSRGITLSVRSRARPTHIESPSLTATLKSPDNSAGNERLP